MIFSISENVAQNKRINQKQRPPSLGLRSEAPLERLAAAANSVISEGDSSESNHMPAVQKYDVKVTTIEPEGVSKTAGHLPENETSKDAQNLQAQDDTPLVVSVEEGGAKLEEESFEAEEEADATTVKQNAAESREANDEAGKTDTEAQKAFAQAQEINGDAGRAACGDAKKTDNGVDEEEAVKVQKEGVAASSQKGDTSGCKASDDDAAVLERRKSLRVRKNIFGENALAKKESTAEERRKSSRMMKRTPAKV
ncbi:unnamed protein product [Gongylonema pulchrum]|uniref:Uncharacterized protein n=1 Tax=Gongylonema pulchrum TaxID=637853 RepID=A0A183D5E8_9BILA|nr:unnamed protein product [Gongylonema pulchrum]